MRYPLRAAVVYRWRDADGTERCGRGRTQDLSEEGVMVSSENCPAVGEPVDLVLRVPTTRSPVPAPPLRMNMKARVVRLQGEGTEGKNLGFAVHRWDCAGATESKSQRPTLSYVGLGAGLRAN
jgi:hypothetical protein